MTGHALRPVSGPVELLARRIYEYYQDLSQNNGAIQSTVRHHPYAQPVSRSGAISMDQYTATSTPQNVINLQDIVSENAAINQQLQQLLASSANLSGGLLSSLFSLPAAPTLPILGHVGLGWVSVEWTPVQHPIASPFQLPSVQPQNGMQFMTPAGIQGQTRAAESMPSSSQGLPTNQNNLSPLIISITAS